MSRKNKLIVQYVEAVSAGEAIARVFILSHRSEILQVLGKQVLREFILNYRSHFQGSNSTRLIKDFKAYIVPKTTHHRSDVAIARNILRNCKLSKDQESFIVDFMFNRLKHNMPADLLDAIAKSNSVKIKKGIVLEYVRNFRSSDVLIHKTLLSRIFSKVLYIARRGFGYKENKI